MNKTTQKTGLEIAVEKLESPGFQTHVERKYNKRRDISGYILHAMKAKNIVDGRLLRFGFNSKFAMHKADVDIYNIEIGR